MKKSVIITEGVEIIFFGTCFVLCFFRMIFKKQNIKNGKQR